MDFYVLERRPKRQHETARTNALEAEPYTFGEAPRCPVCGGYVGMRTWLPPWRVEIETWGKSFGDLALYGTEWLLASERFKEIYERNEMSGLSGFEPIEIVKVRRYSRPRGELPTYLKVNVVRSRTAVDRIGSEWSQDPCPCPECLLPTNKEATIKRWKGLAIQVETWQGEDIFIARGSGEFITSSRCKHVCEANGVKNAIFVPVEEYGGDFYPWEQADTSGSASA